MKRSVCLKVNFVIENLCCREKICTVDYAQLKSHLSLYHLKKLDLCRTLLKLKKLLFQHLKHRVISNLVLNRTKHMINKKEIKVSHLILSLRLNPVIKKYCFDYYLLRKYASKTHFKNVVDVASIFRYRG